MEKYTDITNSADFNDFFIEEEADSGLEVAGTWGSVGTFGSTVGGCASTVGTASSAG